jgi:selenocysteine lyase/cysteine desulfurase
MSSASAPPRPTKLTRAKVQKFLNAPHQHEIIFVRGTTEGINLVTQTWGRKNVKEGDEVIIAAMEHHSNIVPWQMLCEEKGAHLRVIPIERSRRADPRRIRQAAQPAHPHGGRRPRFERARHHQPVRKSSKWRTTPAP